VPRISAAGGERRSQIHGPAPPPEPGPQRIEREAAGAREGQGFGGGRLREGEQQAGRRPEADAEDQQASIEARLASPDGAHPSRFAPADRLLSSQQSSESAPAPLSVRTGPSSISPCSPGPDQSFRR
jgi:hypothetical protein